MGRPAHDTNRTTAHNSSMRGRIALLLVPLAAAGCAGAEADEQGDGPRPNGLVSAAIARTQAAPLPKGFHLRESREARVGLAFPPGWQALTATDARFPGVMQMFGKLNRGLARSVAALSVPDGPMKLLGFDPRFEDGFATTASVMAVRTDADTRWEEWSRRMRAYVERLPSRRSGIESCRVELPLGDALRLEYLRTYGSASRRIATLQYFVAAGDRAYIVTFATLPELKRRYAPLFTASAETLRVTG